MNLEQSSETGYGLVMTPGSIVTDFGKSQLVDPRWSKFDFDQQNVVFLAFAKPNKALASTTIIWHLAIYLFN